MHHQIVPKQIPFGRFQIDWTFRTQCKGRKIPISTKNSDTKIRITDISECAKKCRGISSMFTFGKSGLTWDGKETGCSVYGCECHCEIDASSDGSCEKPDSYDDTVLTYNFDRGSHLLIQNQYE